MRKLVTVNVFNIVWNDEDFFKHNDDVDLELPSFINNVALEVVYDKDDDFDPAVEYKINEYLNETHGIEVESFDWQYVCEEEHKEKNMAKNKKKAVQEKEHILIIEPKSGNDNIVNPEEVFKKDAGEKQEVTDAMNKAQELMNNAVNEVLDGIISKKELLSIAIRKVRATSVLSVEEDDALGKLHIEVKVWF